MKQYIVKNECVDRHTGRRLVPGTPFEPRDREQEARLIEANCLREPERGEMQAAAQKAEPAAAQDAPDATDGDAPTED